MKTPLLASGFRWMIAAAARACWVLGVSLVFGTTAADAKSYRVSVAAEQVDRAGIVVRFALPPDAPVPAVLRDQSDREVALQLEPGGKACFTVATQKAGEVLNFSLVPGAAPTERVAAKAANAGALPIVAGDAPVLSFRTDRDVLPRSDIAEKFKRAGYVHPVFSPAGQIVTGDYPSNHVHHHGIWTAWSRTEFQGRKPNFWEMAEQTGTVELVAVDRKWNGPVHGGFVSRQRMIDLPSAVPAINETWELTVYDFPAAPTPVRVFDLTITDACATRDPVVLTQYHYGGLGFRGPDAWDGKGHLNVLTSDGATQRNVANGTRVRWCYLGDASGQGSAAGIAILGSPDNVRAPQPIRVHPEMPFFSFAPTALGDLTIAPDRPYVARYRFVVSDGPPDRARLEAWWNGYALPSLVTLEPR